MHHMCGSDSEAELRIPVISHLAVILLAKLWMCTVISYRRQARQRNGKGLVSWDAKERISCHPRRGPLL